MRVYHDWEFLEDSVTIKPISVGMVREDGEKLYYEFLDAPVYAVFDNPWLMDNVIPGLSAGWKKAMVIEESDKIVKSKLSISRKVYDFLQEALTLDGSLELWGWYSAYDHVCLAQLFGRMIDLPDWCPMYTNDVRQEFRRLGDPEYPRQTEGLHNALADAKFLKKKHEWLMEYERDGAIPRAGIQIGNGNAQNNVF